MEHTKNNFATIGLLGLMLGLIIGYVGATSRPTHQQAPLSNPSGMHGAMDGMTMSLEGKTGEELELAFLDEMVVHHEGAVAMAHTLLKGTKRPELIELGNNIITAQTQEIQMMKNWRMQWFGK